MKSMTGFGKKDHSKMKIINWMLKLKVSTNGF